MKQSNDVWRVVALTALIIGLVLGAGETLIPSCRNYAGTAQDSGYPCRIDRSSRTSEYLIANGTAIPVPFGDELAIILIVGGVVGLFWMSRRRE